MKIYVASSWRNHLQPAVVARLRELGHLVYDFKAGGDGWQPTAEPGGFSWSQVAAGWESWPEDVPAYLTALDHPCAIEGFNRDMGALRSADVCIQVQPCGVSAALELGWATGTGEMPTAVYCSAIREPDLMLKMVDLISNKWSDIEQWVEGLRL